MARQVFSFYRFFFRFLSSASLRKYIRSRKSEILSEINVPIGRSNRGMKEAERANKTLTWRFKNDFKDDVT